GAEEGPEVGTRFGELTIFSEAENRQLKSIRELTQRYLRQNKLEHPLCVAVFGPPGSGKSFAVEQIRDEAFQDSGFKPSMSTINLTQVTDQSDLSKAFAESLKSSDANTVPLVFFDEFDAPRNGAPYGWLSWFLAPMQDGAFLRAGSKVDVGKAILFFAGGTAVTMDEFTRRQ